MHIIRMGKLALEKALLLFILNLFLMGYMFINVDEITLHRIFSNEIISRHRCHLSARSISFASKFHLETDRAKRTNRLVNPLT